MSARTSTASEANDPDTAENSEGGAGPPGRAGPVLVGSCMQGESNSNVLAMKSSTRIL
jgi:hypothetical protein